jgi:hypothetical protein
MSATTATPPTTAKPAERSHATMLVNLMTKNGAEFFHTPEGHPYVTVTVAGHRETMRLTGSACRDYLAREYFIATKKAPPAAALKDALAVLSATALIKSEHPVFVRLARTADAIWLDLGRPEWDAVKVTATGWALVETPDVRFRRPRGILALPVPTRGSDSLATMLSELVNVHDDSSLQLLLGWLVGTLRGKGPYPILSVTGEQGSAKSTACRTLRRLIDPNVADLRSTPKEPRDLMVAAIHGHVLAYDNLSHIDDWFSDALCRLATGGGFSTRQLFSDDDEILFAAERPVIVNGITDIITRPDLLDRAVVVTLDPIPNNQRRRESDLDAQFDALHPHMLGALLDVIVMALKNEATTQLPELPRMADFVTWVTAAEPALGWKTGQFYRTFCENQQRAVETSLDGDVLVDTIRGLTLLTPWTGQLKDLLHEMPVGEHTPKSPKALGNALKRKATALRQIGIHMDLQATRVGGERHIRIWRTSSVSMGPARVLTLPLKRQAVDDDEPVYPVDLADRTAGRGRTLARVGA